MGNFYTAERCAMKLVPRYIACTDLALSLLYPGQRPNDNAYRMHPDRLFALPGSKSQTGEGASISVSIVAMNIVLGVFGSRTGTLTSVAL